MKHPNESALAGGTAQGAEAASADELRGKRTTAPAWPRSGTVRALVLAELRAGRSLTSGQAWRQFGAARLAADVHVLRRMGWPIVSSETLVPSRSGRPTRVVAYQLAECPPGERHGR